MATSASRPWDTTGRVDAPSTNNLKPFTYINHLTDGRDLTSKKYSTGYAPNNFVVSYVRAQYGVDAATGKAVVRSRTFVRPTVTFESSAGKYKYWVNNTSNHNAKYRRYIDFFYSFINYEDYVFKTATPWKNLNGSANPGTITGGSGGNGGKTKTIKPSPPHNYSNDLVYNIGMVTENYFRSLTTKTGGVPQEYLSKGGHPERLANPRYAFSATKAVYNSKGIIAIYVAKGAGTASDTLSNMDLKNQKRYGFQFHYNPTTIAMGYAGVLNVSPGFMASGKDKFVAAGADSTPSKISFDITLNRRSDLNYFNTDGTLANGKSVTDIYGAGAGSQKTAKEVAAELKDIYNKGTMYDIEYLTNTLLGFKVTTELRGDTSDFGYISARPLELHLGRTFRYLGRIDSFNVQHAMFDERMVPILSTVHIEFARYPDQIKKSSTLA